MCSNYLFLGLSLEFSCTGVEDHIIEDEIEQPADHPVLLRACKLLKCNRDSIFLL